MFTPKRTKDSTALRRQQRRISKLKSEGISRTTLFVHEECRPVLDELRPMLIDRHRVGDLNTLLDELRTDAKPVNVSQVKHLSPFRYPGGKTWLVPEIRNWLRASTIRPDVFVEPFAGGAIAGLTVAAEKLAYSVFLSELDDDVAAVWLLLLDGSEDDIAWLCDRIGTFEINIENVTDLLNSRSHSARERAFRTIVKNRVQRGGILAAGAGLVRSGEAGKGLRSRWYPETLVNRTRAIREMRNGVSFVHCDAFLSIRQFSANPNAFFFLDPPYTAGGKRAGARLYTHSEVDHERLFSEIAKVRGPAMFSYDDTEEVKNLARKYCFRVVRIPMKNTHHSILHELLIFKA